MKTVKNKKYSKKKRKTLRGGNWFARPTSKMEEKITDSCETDCNRNAKLLCERTCKSVSLRSLDTATNSIINKEYIEGIIKKNKKIEEENDKLKEDFKKMKHEVELLRHIYKVPRLPVQSGGR